VAIVSTPNAAVQRLRLRTELRRARGQAELTQRQVADRMEWHPSKLIRIEAGEVAVTVNDLKALLAAYGVTDRRRTEKLLELARGSRKLPFSEYRDVFPKEFLSFLALESSASVVRGYHFFVIPGLFQTEEYIRAMAAGTAQSIAPERLDRLVEARLARQELLEGEDGPQLDIILDESVLHRRVGGPGVMKTQLERLLELTAHPRVRLRVLPFSVGAHRGLFGPFTVFEFSEEGMPDTVYLENPRGESFSSNDPETTGRYLDAYWALEDDSVGDGVGELLHGLLARLEEGGTGPLPLPVPAAAAD
jgi:transcriptional regulator with XRE-family HTH domain